MAMISDQPHGRYVLYVVVHDAAMKPSRLWTDLVDDMFYMLLSTKPSRLQIDIVDGRV